MPRRACKSEDRAARGISQTCKATAKVVEKSATANVVEKVNLIAFHFRGFFGFDGSASASFAFLGLRLFRGREDSRASSFIYR